MRLQPLHFLEGREPGVRVVESHDIAVGHHVLPPVIQERTAIDIGRHWPANGMDDGAGPMVLLGDFPQLLDPDAEGLRIDAFAEVEHIEQFLGQAPPAALGENRISRAQFHPGGEIGPVGAIAIDPHVPGGDPYHPPVLDQHLGRREARVDLDAQFLRLGTEPAHHVAERGDIVAMVVQGRRCRQPDGAVFGQEQEPVIGRRRGEGRSPFLPVRDQLVQRPRLDHRAGEDMRAHFAALLHHANRRIRSQLFQPDRRRETRRPGANDHHIEFHLLACHALGHIRSLRCHPNAGG